jgi:hypothetical protein
LENLKFQRTINSRFLEKFGTKEPCVPVIFLKKPQRTVIFSGVVLSLDIDKKKYFEIL